MTLPLPGESEAPKRRPVHKRVAAAVPEPVWTLERVARAVVVYAALIGFVVCLASGGGSSQCITGACAKISAMVPAAVAAATPTPGVSP